MRRRSLLVVAIAATILLLLSPRTRAPLSAAAPAAGAETGQVSQSEFDRALQAELVLHPRAVVLPMELPCEQANDPQAAICIGEKSNEQTADLGIAVFNAGYPDRAGMTEVLGRAADGAWQPWFASQQQVNYQLLTLPGSILICSVNNLVNVRASASSGAKSVALLTSGTPARAESFLLTQAGSFEPTAPAGLSDGWYHITAPVDGWVSSRQETDATLGTCRLHDIYAPLSERPRAASRA